MRFAATQHKSAGTSSAMLALHFAIWGDFSGFHRRAHPGSAEITSAGQKEGPQTRKRESPCFWGFESSYANPRS